jgi:hypothetical protein
MLGKRSFLLVKAKFALGKHIRGQSICEVQVEDGNGGILEFDTQEGVQNAIFNEVLWKRYNLLEEVPICKGSLRRQFGYMSTLPMAWSVLDGSYDFLPDIDKAMKDFFEEYAKICYTRLLKSGLYIIQISLYITPLMRIIYNF